MTRIRILEKTPSVQLRYQTPGSHIRWVNIAFQTPSSNSCMMSTTSIRKGLNPNGSPHRYVGLYWMQPSAVAPSVIEDRDDHSSWSASSTSNEDLPELSSLEMPQEWPQHVSSQGYAGGSIEALLADFNTPVEHVRLADGRWLYAKIFGYNACDDASSLAPVSVRLYCEYVYHLTKLHSKTDIYSARDLEFC